jgi:hypothetical protein
MSIHELTVDDQAGWKDLYVNNIVCHNITATGAFSQNATGFSSTVSGPWSATAATFTIAKLGNQVSLQSAAISRTEEASAIIGFNTALPAAYWPNISVSVPVVIINDSVQETGYLSVDSSSGQMTISRNIGAFTGAGTAGYRSFCVGYQSA